MLLTDTHTHQYYQTDPQKRQELMQRCLDNNIGRLFLPNVDSASKELVLNQVAAFPEICFAMLGLHPCDVKENWQGELRLIKEAIPSHKIYAIGEIGIALYWDKTTLDIQVEAFKIQIAWAKELKLPIVIHCRNSYDEVFQVLKEEYDQYLRGILHCFTGTLEQARQLIDIGFYLGIGCVVTYKNSGLDKVVEQVDLKHLVLETDSPYLTPVPFRGKPNESSYIIYVAEKVAELHQISIEAVAEITTQNSKLVFGI